MWRVLMFSIMALAFFGTAAWYTFLVVEVGGLDQDPGNSWGCIMSYVLGLACAFAAVISVKLHMMQSKEYQEL